MQQVQNPNQIWFFFMVETQGTAGLPLAQAGIWVHAMAFILVYNLSSFHLVALQMAQQVVATDFIY